MRGSGHRDHLRRDGGGGGAARARRRGRDSRRRSDEPDRGACAFRRRRAGDCGARPCRNHRFIDRARAGRAGVAAKDLDGVAAAAGPGLIGGVSGRADGWQGRGAGLRQAIRGRQPPRGPRADRAPDRQCRLPYLILLASGGHTQILAVKGVGDYDRLGATMDDAIGEAFDKTAKLLGLPFPGGPAVEAAARDGDPARFALPRPLIGRPNADFSFSGLKTAVRLAAERLRRCASGDVADLCASFQAAVVDVVEDRIRTGLKLFRRRKSARRPGRWSSPAAWRRTQRCATGADPLLRGGGWPAVRRAAATAVHRQRRDDRLGGDRAAQARDDRRARRSGPGRAGRSTRNPSARSTTRPEVSSPSARERPVRPGRRRPAPACPFRWRDGVPTTQPPSAPRTAWCPA